MNNSNQLPVTSNLISASAGTGKTYQLSSRFIALLALGYPPENLIALTFTRNAAGEFKERILNDLAKGAESDTGAAELRERIRRTCLGDAEGKMVPLCPHLQNVDAFTSAFFRDLLKRVVANLAKLQLSTNDSFFNRLVCSHSLELGYSSISQMTDAELVKVQCRALKSLLLCDKEEEVAALKVLLHDAEELNRREKGSLNVLLKNTKRFYSMYKDVSTQAWGNCAAFPHLAAIVECLEQCPIDQREQELRRFVEEMGRNLEAKLDQAGNALDYNARNGIGNITKNFLAGKDQPAGAKMLDFLYKDEECNKRLEPLRKKVLELIETAEQAQPQISGDDLNRFKTEIEEMVYDLYNVRLDTAEDLRGDLMAIRGLIEKCGKKRNARTNFRTGLEKFVDLDAARAADELRNMAILARDTVIMLPVIMKTRNLRALMEKFDTIYDEDVRGAGKLVFDDITRAVPRLLDLTNENNIAYRLDSRAGHWMLDEFQDTSPAQWDALHPLLQQVRGEISEASDLQARRSLFVVGDEKQSIYGFRGASPQLFAHLQNSAEWNSVLKKSEQNVSQRSADTIMGPWNGEPAGGETAAGRTGFVNALFAALARNQQSMLPGFDFDRFRHHDIAPRVAELKGYVSIEHFSKKDVEPDPETNPVQQQETVAALDDSSTLERMCLRIAEHLGPNGINFAGGERQITAAILVRTNADVLTVYKWFCENSNVPVMPMGEVRVSQASFLGELLFHLFKWLQHPGNDYSRSLLQASPLQVLKRSGASSRSEWHALRRMLEEQGIAAVIQRVVQGVPDIQNDAIFLEWINAARAFDVSGGDLDEWLLYIENLEVKMVPPKSYVHVMTYHKSKGAEYDVVFLPMNACNSMLGGNQRTLYKSESVCEGRAVTTGIVLAPGVVDLGYENSPYARMYTGWAADVLSEALNVLYVAVTRAKCANYIMVNDDAVDTTYSGMMRLCALPEEWGDPEWHKNNKFERKHAAGGTGPELLKEQVTPRRRKVSPSLIAQEQAAAPEAKAGPVHGVFSLESSTYGTAVHACFEQLEWLDANAAELFPGNDSEAGEAVRTALRNPDIAAIFRRPNTCTEAFNEQDIDYIDTMDGKEVWVSGVIDRLVVEYAEDGETALRAHIYDYKTNTMQSDDVDVHDDTLRGEYAAQMSAYRKAVAKALNLDIGKVETTLVAVPRKNAGKAHLVSVPVEKKA